MASETSGRFLHQTSYRPSDRTQGSSLSRNSSNVHHGKSSCRAQHKILRGRWPYENRETLHAKEWYSECHHRRVCGWHHRRRVFGTYSDQLRTTGGRKFRQRTIGAAEENGDFHVDDQSYVVNFNGPIRYRQNRFLSTIFAQGKRKKDNSFQNEIDNVDESC